jgi:hypothetical protein
MYLFGLSLFGLAWSAIWLACRLDDLGKRGARRG